MVLWASSTSFPYRITNVFPTPIPLPIHTVIHGVSMAFRLANIGILGSSKCMQAGARMATSCDILVLAHTGLLWHDRGVAGIIGDCKGNIGQEDEGQAVCKDGAKSWGWECKLQQGRTWGHWECFMPISLRWMSQIRKSYVICSAALNLIIILNLWFETFRKFLSWFIQILAQVKVFSVSKSGLLDQKNNQNQT